MTHTAFSPAAFAADYIRANVPFAFMVGAQQFAPGEYVIKQTDSGVILVQGATKGAMIISTPAASTAKAGSSLRFTSADQRLHLTRVEQEGVVSRAIPLHAVEQRSLTMSAR